MFLKRFFFRTSYAVVVVLSVTLAFALVLLLESKSLIFNSQYSTETEIEPFPVGVYPETKSIFEQPDVQQYFSDNFASNPASSDKWWNQVASLFASKVWYQNLASPVSRIVVIWPGERKEEIAKNIGDVLHWEKSERDEFQNLIDASEPVLSEGKYVPGQYVVHRYVTPSEMSALVYESFKNDVLARYTSTVSDQVPLDDTLIIASLIEREANNFTNMREVSGVIWNRLFINMPLQLDATLQYVRGSNSYEPRWWPAVKPADKFLTSPFNTYQNSGLPPAPIANPSTEAILAALNPIKTDCLYYFHTKSGDYHCSITYEDHVAKLRSLYGRGS